MILGDSTYCRIKTEDVFNGKPGEAIVERTTFGWIIHGGDRVTDRCLFTKETSDYERLSSLDALGVEDREHGVCRKHFKKAEGGYEVNVPWIPGQKLEETGDYIHTATTES